MYFDQLTFSTEKPTVECQPANQAAATMSTDELEELLELLDELDELVEVAAAADDTAAALELALDVSETDEDGVATLVL